VIKIDKTIERDIKISNDIKLAIPADLIAIRKKNESRSGMRGG